MRAKGSTSGRNPNIESILVRHFSYEFPGQTPVVLIENYTDGFWQQSQTEYDSKKLKPVPSVDASSMTEWYTDENRSVGIDRDHNVVAYRTFTR